MAKKTGIDLPGEFAGILPSREWKKINKDEPWYQGETLNTGIGQGFMTTSPLRLAVATAAIANKGQLLIPQILMHSQTSAGNVEVSESFEATQIPIKDIKNWGDYYCRHGANRLWRKRDCKKAKS